MAQPDRSASGWTPSSGLPSVIAKPEDGEFFGARVGRIPSHIANATNRIEGD